MDCSLGYNSKTIYRMSVVALRAVYFHPASFNLPRKNMIFFPIKNNFYLQKKNEDKDRVGSVGGLSLCISPAVETDTGVGAHLGNYSLHTFKQTLAQYTVFATSSKTKQAYFAFFK